MKQIVQVDKIHIFGMGGVSAMKESKWIFEYNRIEENEYFGTAYINDYCQCILLYTKRFTSI